MRRLAPVLLLAVASPLWAQGATHADHADHASHAMHQADGVAAVRPLYEQFRNWLVASAEQMPEADYAYRPVEGVRTFGELIGHVANASFMFCSAASGTKSPATGDYEKVSGKADLVAALKASFAFCDAAYQMPDSKAMAGEIELFGMKGSPLWVLNFNAVHNAEHYGNLVTYTRMKGMVPPSSQR